MTQKGHDKLTPSYSLEVADMAKIPCSGYKDGSKCSSYFEIDSNEQQMGSDGMLRGTVTCSRCGSGTGFEMDERGIVTYVSGRSALGTLGAAVLAKSKTLYAEAEASLLAAIPNAAAAMCRSSVEIALNARGLPSDDNLFKKINDAKGLKPNPLTDEEIMLAHGSRVITREAIHQGDLVELNMIPSMLAATIQVLNKLYP